MNKSKAFTLSEMLVVIVIIGLIGIFVVGAIKVYNPTLKGNTNKGNRIFEEIDQALTLITTDHAPDGTLTYINDSAGAFSIEDTNAANRLATLFKEYISFVDGSEKINYKFKDKSAQKYFKSNILDYNSTSTGKKIEDTFSNFMVSTDGTIWGFKTYNSCSATESLATIPKEHGKRSVSNICASIFYDINAYKGPNKLGFDQFIIPINKTGTYYVK